METLGNPEGWHGVNGNELGHRQKKEENALIVIHFRKWIFSSILNICPFYGCPALCQGNTVRMVFQSLGLRALAKFELGEGRLPHFLFRQKPWWFKCLHSSKWEKCGKGGGRKKELEAYDQVWFFRPSVKTAMQMVSKERSTGCESRKESSSHWSSIQLHRWGMGPTEGKDWERPRSQRGEGQKPGLLILSLTFFPL